MTPTHGLTRCLRWPGHIAAVTSGLNVHRRSSDHLNVVAHRHRDTSPFRSQPSRHDDGHWFTLPTFGVSKFVGQDAILDYIQDVLSQETAIQIRLALHRLGGVGKTQIALKWGIGTVVSILEILYFGFAQRTSISSKNA